MASASTTPSRRQKRRPDKGRVRITVGLAAAYLGLAYETGSLIVPFVLLGGFALLGAGFVAVAHLVGINRDHPAVAWVLECAWRDPRRVFQLAMQSLPETFTWSPSGRWYGHRRLILWLHAGTYGELTGRLRGPALSQWATDSYRDLVTEYSPVLDELGPVHIDIRATELVGRGRWELTHRDARPSGNRRSGARGHGQDPGRLPDLQAEDAVDPVVALPVNPAVEPVRSSADTAAASRPAMGSYSQWRDGPTVDTAGFHDGLTLHPDTRTHGDEHAAGNTEPDTPRTHDAMATVLEGDRSSAAVTPIRLETDGQVQATSKSPAIVGRAQHADIRLNVPTVSREHAFLTHHSGRWLIQSRGRNGLSVNGVEVIGTCALKDEDVLRWGGKPTSPTSKVLLSPLPPPHGPATAPPALHAPRPESPPGA
jgi:hypothetical protein